MNERTNNEFARALVFYYDYRRNKLSEDTLSKIAKKYKSDPTKLLTDLISKYKLYNNGKYIHILSLINFCLHLKCCT